MNPAERLFADVPEGVTWSDRLDGLRTVCQLIVFASGAGLLVAGTEKASVWWNTGDGGTGYQPGAPAWAAWALLAGALVLTFATFGAWLNAHAHHRVEHVMLAIQVTIFVAIGWFSYAYARDWDARHVGPDVTSSSAGGATYAPYIAAAGILACIIQSLAMRFQLR